MGRAPEHLLITIEHGLIGDDLALGPTVVVEVAPHRRNQDGWPSVMVGALVVGPDLPDGVVAVWAGGDAGEPVLPAGGAATELWQRGEQSSLPGYPEAETARRALPEPT